MFSNIFKFLVISIIVPSCHSVECYECGMGDCDVISADQMYSTCTGQVCIAQILDKHVERDCASKKEIRIIRQRKIELIPLACSRELCNYLSRSQLKRRYRYLHRRRHGERRRLKSLGKPQMRKVSFYRNIDRPFYRTDYLKSSSNIKTRVLNVCFLINLLQYLTFYNAFFIKKISVILNRYSIKQIDCIFIYDLLLHISKC